MLRSRFAVWSLKAASVVRWRDSSCKQLNNLIKCAHCLPDPRALACSLTSHRPNYGKCSLEKINKLLSHFSLSLSRLHPPLLIVRTLICQRNTWARMPAQQDATDFQYNWPVNFSIQALFTLRLASSFQFFLIWYIIIHQQGSIIYKNIPS